MSARGCACRHHSTNEISAAALPHGDSCPTDQGCEDARSVSVLDRVMELREADWEMPDLASLELVTTGPGAETTLVVAMVKVVGGPVLPRPLEGWSLGLATEFCGEFLASSPALELCRKVAGVSVADRLDACSQDVLVSCRASHCITLLGCLCVMKPCYKLCMEAMARARSPHTT